MGRQRNRATGKGKGSRARTLMVPLTLVVVLAPAACNSDPTATDEDELFQALFGTWSWIQATGGIAGTTRTPDSDTTIPYAQFSIGKNVDYPCCQLALPEQAPVA